MSSVAQPVKPEAASVRRLDASSLIRALALHRQRPAQGSEYWNEYCRLLRLLCRAGAVVVVSRAESAGWSALGADCPDQWLAGAWNEKVTELYERVRQNGFAYCPAVDSARQQRILAMVRTTGAGDTFIVMDVPERERAQLNELIMRALLAADFPVPAAPGETPAVMPQAQPAPAAGAALLGLLDLGAQVMAQQRFTAAAMLLVNGIAAHFRATQAALGWIDNGAVKVAAVSHLDRFEHNSENARLLEQAFNACLGQPRQSWHLHEAADNNGQELKEAYAGLQEAGGFRAQCLLPVFDADGAVRAILFLGFADTGIERDGIEPLQLTMGFVQPWLRTLREQERGIGWRLARRLRSAGERFMGPDFTWGRGAAAVAALLLLVALFGKWDYHVEASSQLTTDSSRIVSAQFDSRIESVAASAGDMVKEGSLLATLDTREMRQQEMDIRAERQRLSAEADKARAAGNLAEMEIAQARFAQADARLARILHYLAQARAVAPFDGVVVEGERKELLSAPVKKGDKLFKVARIDGLYVEMMVPEREIRYVKPDATGFMRLVSRPDLEIPFKLAAIIPMAQVKGQEGNHFLIKAELLQAPEAWWRPGMSGMVRIEAGKQNILWIWTHRVIDTLRMKLWWLGW
jgi:hypothetical protein